MAHGKAKSTLLGIQGVVGHKNAPDWSFLYETSTIKNPNYNIGDRVALPDGRVYRYALAVDTVKARCGNSFVGDMENDGIVETTLAAGQAVGDKSVTVASQSFAKDELRGGYITLCAGGTTNMQFRGIIGNTYCSSTTVTIYLDAALDTVVTNATEVEVLPNPYRYISGGNKAFSSVAGVAVKSATVGQYFWLQTWGPVRPASGAALTRISRCRQLVFQHDGGSVNWHTTALAITVQGQHAGFILDSTEIADINHAPFIMLQISP